MSVVDPQTLPPTQHSDFSDVDTVAQPHDAETVDAAKRAPEATQANFAESRFVGTTAAQDTRVNLPLLGRRSVNAHQRILALILVVSLAVFASVAGYAVWRSNNVAQQLGNVGTALMQSQRLAKAVSQALVGSASAFPDVAESAASLGQQAHD